MDESMDESKRVVVFLDGNIRREGKDRDYILDADGLPMFNFKVDYYTKPGVLVMQLFENGLLMSVGYYVRRAGKWVVDK